jgi:hypothetical protein
MRKQRLNQRPPEFRLNHGHPLAQGLCFAGLGNKPGSALLPDSSPRANNGTLTAMSPGTDWVFHPALGLFLVDHAGGS